MAKDRELERTPPARPAAQAGAQLRVRWADSDMRSAYANVCNVAGTREEIVLLFGMNQSWKTGQKEVTIRLSDRIIMNPFAAKRLATLLNNTIRDYEFRFGSLNIERRPEDSTVH